MPTLNVNGTNLFYLDSGGSGEPILFSHGFLWDTSLFSPQVKRFKDKYRCICYDHRGQGKSADGVGRSIDMETLTADAEALIAALNLGKVHFCGLSMGGFVGMRLALGRPDLLRSLILMETSADLESAFGKLKYRLLGWVGRLVGFRPLASQVMPALFGKTVLRDPTRAAQREEWKNLLVANRRSVWRALNGVLDRSGVYEQLGKISTPTLVIVGNEDVAFSPAIAKRMADGIRGAKFVVIPRAGHSSTVEEPEAVNAAIAEFLG